MCYVSGYIYFALLYILDHIFAHESVWTYMSHMCTAVLIFQPAFWRVSLYHIAYYLNTLYATIYLTILVHD